jgi:hypothetical protein
MKAAVMTRYGPPEVVHVIDVPRPAPEKGELLVRVLATSVNRTDCGFRAAHPWFIRGFTGLTRPKRTILGNESAGVVEAVGENVRRFAVGDRVFGYDDNRFGGHANCLTIGQDAAVATIPDDLNFRLAEQAPDEMVGALIAFLGPYQKGTRRLAPGRGRMLSGLDVDSGPGVIDSKAELTRHGSDVIVPPLGPGALQSRALPIPSLGVGATSERPSVVVNQSSEVIHVRRN